MSMVRFSLGLGTLTAKQEPDETPREAVARSIARRVGAFSVHLRADSQGADFERFRYTARGRFHQRLGSARILESGHVTIFRARVAPERSGEAITR